MKKLLLAGALAFFGLSDAQIKSGTVYLSGQINYAQEKNNEAHGKDQSFSIIPTVGAFVAPNLAVGTGIGFTYNKREYDITYSSGSFSSIFNYEGKTNAIIVAPFVRKYWTLSDKLYFFGQLEVPMEFGKINRDLVATYIDQYGITQRPLSVERKYTSLGVNVKPGLDYFITKNWSVEATIGAFGYQNLRYKNEENTDLKNNNFSLNLSSVTFGVKYVFAK